MGSDDDTGGWGAAQITGARVFCICCRLSQQCHCRLYKFTPSGHPKSLWRWEQVSDLVQRFWSIRPCREARINLSTAPEPVLGGPACRKTEQMRCPRLHAAKVSCTCSWWTLTSGNVTRLHAVNNGRFHLLLQVWIKLTSTLNVYCKWHPSDSRIMFQKTHQNMFVSYLVRQSVC